MPQRLPGPCPGRGLSFRLSLGSSKGASLPPILVQLTTVSEWMIWASPRTAESLLQPPSSQGSPCKALWEEWVGLSQGFLLVKVGGEPLFPSHV